MSPANWDDCLLCKEEGVDDPPKAVPRHVESEHDITWDKYKKIANQRNEEVDDSSKSDGNHRKEKDEDVDVEGSGHVSEQAISKMALKSFQETMKSENQQKKRLREQAQEERKEKQQLQRRLMEERRNDRQRQQQSSGSDDKEFFKELTLQYLSDMREEKKRAKSDRERELERKVERLEQKIEDKESREREYEEEGGTAIKKIEITDESVKSLTNMGNRLIGMLRQNQMLELAKESDEFPDTADLIKKEFMNMANDMGMGGPKPPSMPSGQQQQQQTQRQQRPPSRNQSTSKNDGSSSGPKDLEDILGEED